MAGQEVSGTKKSRAKYEVIIIVLVVIAAVIVGFSISKAQSKAEKGQLMIAELSQIRAAVATFKTLNRSNPANLQELAKLKYTFSPGEEPRTYISNIAADKEGNLIDPFGNAYTYDTKTGWVKSSTKGYENW